MVQLSTVVNFWANFLKKVRFRLQFTAMWIELYEVHLTNSPLSK